MQRTILLRMERKSDHVYAKERNCRRNQVRYLYVWFPNSRTENRQKVSALAKPIGRLTGKRKEKAKKNKIRDDREDIKLDPTDT